MIACARIPTVLVDVGAAMSQPPSILWALGACAAVFAIVFVWALVTYVIYCACLSFLNRKGTKRRDNMGARNFMNKVSREVDTKGTKINVAETKRVLKCAFDRLAKMKLADVSRIIVGR